jgi:hypothetical protein
LRKRKRAAQKAMREIKRLMRDPENKHIAELLQQDFAHEMQIYSTISKVIKD